MNNRKTDNSNFIDKVYLRISNFPDKKNVKVLDCFYGYGKIWKEIKRIKKNIDFNITGIEKNKNKILKSNDFIFHGDNLKYLSELDLSKYDIIDLDAYGSPAKQMLKIFNNKSLKREIIIFFTNIYTIYGAQPKEILNNQGINLKLYRKCMTIFNKKRLDFFYNFLYTFGIRTIEVIEKDSNSKYYGSFIYNPV